MDLRGIDAAHNPSNTGGFAPFPYGHGRCNVAARTDIDHIEHRLNPSVDMSKSHDSHQTPLPFASIHGILRYGLVICHDLHTILHFSESTARPAGSGLLRWGEQRRCSQRRSRGQAGKAAHVVAS